MYHISIINGPNLNLLGTREPAVYGSQSFDSYFEVLSRRYSGEVAFEYFQSNIEGELIEQIQAARGVADGIILNAAGYTHTSVAIADAVLAVGLPTIEVHISNVFRRETVRQHSLLSAAAMGTIGGFGLDSYRLATEALLAKFNNVK